MVTQTIGWGTTISLIGVLAAPIGASLGMTSGAIYAGVTLMFLIGAAAAPLSGRIIDRIGGLHALCLGTPFLAAGLAALALAKGPATYFGAWVLFGLGMHVGLATAAYSSITQALGRDAYRGIGVLALATGLCSTVFWPLSEAALDVMGWRMLCGVYAGVILLVCMPAHLALARHWGRAGIAAAATGVEESPAHVPPELARRAFLLLATMVTLTSSIGTTMGILASDLFVALGTTREAAVVAGSLVGVAFLASRGIDVALGGRVPRMTLARLIYGMLPLSLLPLLACALAGVPLPAWLATLSAVLYGIPAGLLGVLRPALPFHIFGSFAYGHRLGRLALPMDLANAVAPAAFAWIMHRSPEHALSIMVGMAGTAFIAALVLGTLVSEGPNLRHYAGSSV